MKMRLHTIALLLPALMLGSCGGMKTTEPSMKEQDPHSYAVPVEAKVKHLNWAATVDFNSKTIDAEAAWEIENTGNADSIRFDTKDLEIKSITIDDGPSTEYRLAKTDPILGQALVVAIKPETKVIRIQYRTSPEA